MSTKQITDYPDYNITDEGNIWSNLSNKWLKTSPNSSGYYTVRLRKDGIAKTLLVHRLVWTTFNGTIPDGKEINHKDEDKANNSLSNLELTTHKENCNFGTRIERCASKHRKYNSEEERQTMKKIKDAEWREKNREYLKQRNKDYYERHKAKF